MAQSPPPKVENINLSHNLLADTLVWDEFFTPEIHNLDLSHNRLKLFVPFFRFMDTLNLANNDLRCYVEFTYASMFPCDKISFVDVSGNPQLSTNILSYYGEKTSTFRHNGTPWDRTPPKRDEKAGAALAKKLKFTHRIWNAL